MRGCYVGDIQPISDALVDEVVFPLCNHFPDLRDVVLFDRLKEFWMCQFLFLDLFDEFAVLVAEDEGVEFVVEILGEAVEEPVVELDQGGNQGLGGLEHAGPDRAFGKAGEHDDVVDSELHLLSSLLTLNPVALVHFRGYLVEPYDLLSFFVEIFAFTE